jgi:hypothetical protein
MAGRAVGDAGRNEREGAAAIVYNVGYNAVLVTFTQASRSERGRFLVFSLYAALRLFAPGRKKRREKVIPAPFVSDKFLEDTLVLPRPHRSMGTRLLPRDP